MGSEELLAAIRADTEARVRQIESERDAAVKEIEARARAVAAAIESEARRQTDASVAALLDRARGKARLLVRNAVLAARWRVLRCVVTTAEQRVLSDPEYPELVSELVARYAKKDAVVTMSQLDSERLGARLAVQPQVSVGVVGGVVIRSGKTVFNFSLRETLDELCVAHAKELGELLFGVSSADDWSVAANQD